MHYFLGLVYTKKVVVSSLLFMVEYYAVVENSHLNVWEARVVTCFMGNFFPIPHNIVGNVSDGTANEPENPVWKHLTRDDLLNSGQRIGDSMFVFCA